MSNFGELCLVLGDLHIPTRASKIPAPFKRMLVPNKMQHVICTGNVSLEDYQELCSLAPNIHMVAGEYDNLETQPAAVEQAGQPASLVFPETRVIQIGEFRIGVIHGHQLLPWSSRAAIERMRRLLRVDILVAGHSHKNEVTPEEGYINPGSITGAYSSLMDDEAIPSFVLLAIQGSKMVCYVYELDRQTEEVNVSKTEFTKKEKLEDTPLGSSANPALLQSLLK